LWYNKDSFSGFFYVILEINRIYIDSITAYKKVIQAAKGDCLARTVRGFFVIKSE